MKIQIPFETDDLLALTTAQQDREIAESIIGSASDEAIIEQVMDRVLVEDILDSLDDVTRAEIFEGYGFIYKE